MARSSKQLSWAIVAVCAVGVGMAVGSVGCKPGGPTDPTAVPDATSGQTGTGSVLDPQMHQSFADATLADPPSGWDVPPDQTLAGKSVGVLYDRVKSRWADIRYVSSAGKRLAYRATIDTEVGAIEIALRPEIAPNHVRSFIALSQAGYYDGLVFERTFHDERPEARLDMLEAGCPLGIGDISHGSIGYWLKPEINPKATHEEGTVGACKGASDAEACRFYITLGRVPAMDGDYTVFGKVTQGIDVARKILSLPLSNDSPEGDRPLKPVVIRKVTITGGEVEN